MNCTTHHHACECREKLIKELLRELYWDTASEEYQKYGDRITKERDYYKKEIRKLYSEAEVKLEYYKEES